jgi:hypothetical protein
MASILPLMICISYAFALTIETTILISNYTPDDQVMTALLPTLI